MAEKLEVFDTDVMIDYWNTSSKRHEEMKHIINDEIGLNKVVISAITKMELLPGANNKSKETKIRKKLQRFNTALINNEITLEAIDLLINYHRSHGLSIPDSFNSFYSQSNAA